MGRGTCGHGGQHSTFAEASEQSFGGGTDIPGVEGAKRGTTEREGARRHFQTKLIFKDINMHCGHRPPRLARGVDDQRSENRLVPIRVLKFSCPK